MARRMSWCVDPMGVLAFGKRFFSWRAGRGNASPYRSIFKFSQAQAERSKLLLDFVEAGLAEVFASEQFGFGACGELADGVDVQALKRFAAADGELKISNCFVGDLLWHVAQSHRRRTPGRALGILQSLAETQAFGGEKRLDFIEAGFAEVLVAEQLGL